jgi:hypothetical protein
MIRLVAAAALAGFSGVALLLAETRWARRDALAERLRPHAPARRGHVVGSSDIAWSFRASLGPMATDLGARLIRALGVHDDLEVRLARIHSESDATSFRLRQLGQGVLGLGLAASLVVVALPPPVVAVVIVVGAPLLALLAEEQRLCSASARWQRRVRLEIPVVTEQLGLLLGAGYSVPGALNRLALRSDGACARDLTRVCGRLRQGAPTAQALREWAAIAGVPQVDRLVTVLLMADGASDLGPLISSEARSSRQDLHRDLVARVERSAQQVWIPVTVAALVPGVIVIGVPFLHAVGRFASG